MYLPINGKKRGSMFQQWIKNKTLSVIAPAGKIDPDLLGNAADIWRKWGAGVRIMPHVTGFEDMFFSASAELRASDLNMAVADDETDFIICARGGYGCAMLSELIDWELLRRKNKMIIGYSDVTALHQMMLKNNAGIPICGAMFLKAPELFAADAANAESFVAAAEGRETVFDINVSNPFNGKCVVANLAVLASLCGTDKLSDMNGKCLILEDLNEAPYRIHRMMSQLEQSGVFNDLGALAFGEFLDCGDDGEIKKILASFADKYSFPIYYGLPAGHGNRIYAVNMKRNIRII